MKNSTKIKIAKKYQDKIDEIYHDGDGYWAYSKTGYHFADMGGQCHTAHEDTQIDLIRVIKSLEDCNCRECK